MKNNMNEPITIGITSYNAEKTIARAVRSAVAQEWDHTEILVVDDCSTDNSWQILQGLAKLHNNIRLLRTTKNGGPACARQLITEEASSDLIAFFDDDDVSLPNRLKVQHKRLLQFEKDKCTKYVACFASGTRTYPNGHQMDLVAIGSQGEEPWGNAIADRLLLFKSDHKYFFGGGTPTCSLMIRKSTITAAGGFDSTLRRVEDADFAIRLGYLGGHFIGCPEKLFLQYSTQGTDKSAEINLEAELQLVDNHSDYLNKIGYYYYARNWPLLRYYYFKRNYSKLASVLILLFLKHPIKTSVHFFTSASKRLIHEANMR